MPQPYLNLSPDTWYIIFLVVRYVLVALLLAYLTGVFVKRKNIITDVRGQVTEWQVETYKDIHRWLMKFKTVIAAAAQDEAHYSDILSYTKFKIGYQGMEYASFFHDPVRLLQMDDEFNRLLNKEESFVDKALKRKLHDFRDWLDEVIDLFSTFVRTEGDKAWHFDAKLNEQHCTLACLVMGIALQEDVNTYFNQLDSMLRDRLGSIRLAGTNGRGGVRPYFGKSQLRRNQFGLMTIFMLVHFEEDFVKNPSWTKDKDLFLKRTNDYLDCYKHYYDQ